jgi:hypothetical protein
VAEERERRRKFGEVRPLIHADHKGYKVVAVGSEVHFSKRCRTVPDFLADYIVRKLTGDWAKGELAKPFQERHVIMQWYEGMCRYQQKQQRGPDGLYAAFPNGSMRAYLLLAHDLYTLRHHGALQATVVDRLKHKDQFQGARHELLAAATCIRAGYTIKYEDERDPSRRHVELIATHQETGQVISVEAKSRHRPGVLGFDGDRQDPSDIRAGIRRLLKDALDKPAVHPYVIFFDLNLPATQQKILTTPWFREVANTVADLSDRIDGGDPFNLIVFSNQPDHYLEDDVPSSGGETFSIVGRSPLIRPTHPQALMAVHEAANKFGIIPNSFEEAD